MLKIDLLFFNLTISFSQLYCYIYIQQQHTRIEARILEKNGLRVTTRLTLANAIGIQPTTLLFSWF